MASLVHPHTQKLAGDHTKTVNCKMLEVVHRAGFNRHELKTEQIFITQKCNITITLDRDFKMGKVRAVLACCTSVKFEKYKRNSRTILRKLYINTYFIPTS